MLLAPVHAGFMFAKPRIRRFVIARKIVIPQSDCDDVGGADRERRQNQGEHQAKDDVRIRRWRQRCSDRNTGDQGPKRYQVDVPGQAEASSVGKSLWRKRDKDGPLVGIKAKTVYPKRRVK
jgi:hypothetical protein